MGSWPLSGLGSGLCLLTSTKVLLLNMWQVKGLGWALPLNCSWAIPSLLLPLRELWGWDGSGFQHWRLFHWAGTTLGRHFTFCASFLIRKPGVCQACCCVNSPSVVLAADSAEELRASAERWCSWLGPDCGPCQNPSFQTGSVSVGHPHVLPHLNLARFCRVTWLVPFYRQGWALQRARTTVPV